ncbi:MAG: hypothetical protein K6E92_05345 [Lachnospiraceae bacterium]|nr:hypothetical protein [Lachnospiraceae bacterium]
MNVGTNYATYSAGYPNAVAAPQAKAKSDTAADKASTEKQNDGVIYERSSDRAAIVSQLKSAAEQRQNQLVSLVQKTLSGQAATYGKATGKDIWRTLASGNFTVDPATKAQAQKDIGEDGYWGVKQTSQRLFDFASALAGDDVEKMKELEKAMEKGFKMATKTWGKELPGICSDTMKAAHGLFEEYYRSKETASS